MKTTFFLALTLAGAILAQDKTPVVAKRQVNQQKRIAEGVNDGNLTRKETRRLQAQERELQREKRAAKADGVVSSGERQELRQDSRKLSRRIAKQKNDAQTQPVKP